MTLSPGLKQIGVVGAGTLQNQQAISRNKFLNCHLDLREHVSWMFYASEHNTGDKMYLTLYLKSPVFFHFIQ